MGANPDDVEEADSTPPPPGTKVHITVGGHTIEIESPEPLDVVADCAMRLFRQTSEPAKRIPFGFDATGGQFERAEPYREPSGMEQWGDEDARRLGRHQRNYAQDGTTRRLGIPDPPGHHRSRLRTMPVDREQRPMP